MITILTVYTAIAAIEWRYLRRNKRKKRTFLLVFGILVLLFLSSEALYLWQDRFQLAVVIEAVFGPLERAMLLD